MKFINDETDHDVHHQLGIKKLTVWSNQHLSQPYSDWLAEEVPVALIYNGISHVVMMTTPKELECFALGFSLAEGIISNTNELHDINILSNEKGIEIHMELSSRRFFALKEHRRAMTGRTGCGVCGVEQLNDILQPIPPLPFTQSLSLRCLEMALPHLKSFQPIGQLTGCTHVAAWLNNEGALLAGCEDIGRHVALDKLLGKRAIQQWQQGAILVSSRASYEMVQKSAMCGVEILFAVSAATTLAIQVAQQCGLTLIGFCKPGRAVIYTHPERINE